ncbi:MAG: hypothetical protein ACKVT0_22610 [Planctomycetaceae bacterium]
MSSRWFMGICLGSGVALIVSGLAQSITEPQQPAPLENPSAIEHHAHPDSALQLEPNDPAAATDRSLADEFSKALQNQDGVSVLRNAHAGDGEKR